MKKAKRFWNYLDMSTQAIIFLGIIVVTYYICEELERYFYRYTVFPLVAFVCIFTLGIIFGKSLERTSKVKPIGFFSKQMDKVRKRKNSYIFRDDEETYTPNKEIIEEIKSGNISHVKQYKEEQFDQDDFKDVYKVDIDNILDDKMNEDEENK